MLSKQKVFALGFQHVLAMYAGAVVVPLIVGNALNLTPAQMAYLIAADLFTCGIATLLQTMNTKYFGSGLPVVLGCTFTAVGPIIAIGTSFNLGHGVRSDHPVGAIRRSDGRRCTASC